jgi:hypothetical protein
MSSEKSTPNDRDDSTRQVSDELLRKASEGPVRHLPDALFGGPAPVRPGDAPDGGDTTASGAERSGAVSDELLRRASEGPVRHLPDLLFGGPVPEPAVQEEGSGADEGGHVGSGTASDDSEGDTGPPAGSATVEFTARAGDPVPPAEAAGAAGAVDLSRANSVADQGDSGFDSYDGNGSDDAGEVVESPSGEPPAAADRSTNTDVADSGSAQDADSGVAEADSSSGSDVVAVGGSVADSDAVVASGANGSGGSAEESASVTVESVSGETHSDAAGAAEADGDPRAGRPVLLVIADSLSYFGPRGGLSADDPRIWPNLVATELDWDVELVARIGWTCRDAYWALIGDPRVWAAVPRAGAVVFATGGMDSLPSPLPTALRELIRYVRPPAVRRRVREGYNWLQPRLAKLGRPVALPPQVSVDYLEQSRTSLAQLRPDLPVVGVLPSVHDCEAYGRVHSGREPAVRALREWSAKTAVPLVDLGEAVRENVFHGESNPDGIHWGWEGHTAVARAMVKVIAEVRS